MKRSTLPKQSKEPASEPLTLEQALVVIQELQLQIYELKAENQKLNNQCYPKIVATKGFADE